MRAASQGLNNLSLNIPRGGLEASIEPSLRTSSQCVGHRQVSAGIGRYYERFCTENIVEHPARKRLAAFSTAQLKESDFFRLRGFLELCYGPASAQAVTGSNKHEQYMLQPWAT
jgi:hypothetical protein